MNKTILVHGNYATHYYFIRLEQVGCSLQKETNYTDVLLALQAKEFSLLVIDPLSGINVGEEYQTFDELERRAPGLRLIRRLRRGEFLTPKETSIISLSVLKNPEVLAELKKLGVIIVDLDDFDSPSPITNFVDRVNALLK